MLMVKPAGQSTGNLDVFFRHMVGNMRNGVLAIDRGGVTLTTKIGVSIGVAVPDPPGPRSPDALLAAGDAAMYAAKRSPDRRTTVVRV